MRPPIPGGRRRARWPAARYPQSVTRPSSWVAATEPRRACKQLRPGAWPRGGTRKNMVGATGFEPATTSTPRRCATGLRYAPTLLAMEQAYGRYRSRLRRLGQAPSLRPPAASAWRAHVVLQRVQELPQVFAQPADRFLAIEVRER